MERRALLRSLGLVGVGALAAACGTRTSRPQATAPDEHRSREPDPPAPNDRPTAEADTAEAVEPAPDEGAEEGPGSQDERRSRVVEVLCRDAVGLAAPAAVAASHRIDRLTLHHTAVPLESAARAPERLRRHLAFHREQGWVDIAYHYAVDLAGNVYELRDPAVPGDTFTDYDPHGHLQVVCEGDFDRQHPTEELLDAVSQLFAGLALGRDLAPASLQTHRTYVPSTACPGGHLLDRLGEIRTEVERLVVAGDVAVTRVCGGDAEARVAAIEAG